MSKQNKQTFGPCSLKQQLLLSDFSTDILLAGGSAGSGKSRCCLTKYLPNSLSRGIDDPNFKCIIFRRSQPELMIAGGMIDESHKIYPHFGGVFKAQQKKWVFPSGGFIQFKGMPDNMKTLQGLQATHILIDEAGEDWKEDEIIFLLSRIRSGEYKGKKQFVLTCNPNKDSFLFKWIEWCLAEDTGIPVKGTENITKYFLNVNNAVKWGESAEELIEKWGHTFDRIEDCLPKTFRFIPMTLEDNKVLMRNDPSYKANLLAQSYVNQLRYYLGSWTAREEGSNLFDRSWVTMVDAPSSNAINRVRSWDMAFTTNKASDYTASTLMSRDKLGIYTIEHVCRFKKLPDGVLQEIAMYGRDDGDGVTTTIPRDNGGGAAAAAFFVKQLAENGLVVKTIQTSGAASKSKRFLPFSAVAQAGFVRVVKAPWNEEFFQELENFIADKRGQHDDMLDTVSDCFNTLAKQLQLPTFSIPDLSRASLSSRCS